MSSENQNGSATNNGIKSSIGVGPNAAPRTTTNTNSSLLYNCNSVLNRDLKSRQGGGPPTLPKYASSLNPGSNGSGIADIRIKDREIGGSYRLASLDRLAMKQRILDGGTANGDANSSIQTKREMFFKGETITSPPSVPPPQPPQGSTTTTTSSTTTTTSTTNSIVSPTGGSSNYNTPNNVASNSAKGGRISHQANNHSDSSEDSNKRETVKPAFNNLKYIDATSKEFHQKQPTVFAKSKELEGYVGFANLPNQVYRKAVKKGFDFTLMVVGESGLGKSTLINSMFLSDIYSVEYPGPSLRVKKTVAVETSKVLLKENGVDLTLTVVDTPGFGDAVDNSNCWVPVIDYIESKYEEFLNAELRVVRRQIADNRVHCCLYFVAPSGHGLKPLDVEFMQRLHDKVNIIPVIAKADTMTPDECAYFKKQILNEIAQHKIKIYEFPETEEEEENKLHKVLRDRVPFAVVGANTVVEHDGKKVRGRKYPWGVAEVENLEHCDFIALRNMVIRTHLQDLKEVTNNVHYENFRCRSLAGVGKDGKPIKVTNKNPLAQLEEEKREQDAKLKKLQIDMEKKFEIKVREEKQKLKDSENELQRRHDQMRSSFEQQSRELDEKRTAYEKEKTSWEAMSGHTVEELRRRSLEANSKETVDGKDKKSKKKGLFLN